MSNLLPAYKIFIERPVYCNQYQVIEEYMVITVQFPVSKLCKIYLEHL